MVGGDDCEDGGRRTGWCDDRASTILAVVEKREDGRAQTVDDETWSVVRMM
jgi:hypothetical protein